MKSSLLMLPLLALGTVAGHIVDPWKIHGQPPAKGEKEKLKGDWILVSNESRGIIAEIFGQVPEPDRIRIATFSDKELTLKVDRDSTVLGYELDPTQSPKNLDITIKLRDGKKVTLP